MWSHEYAAETDLPTETVWAALRDLHTGDLTYDGADAFDLHGPFAVGSTLTVTPVGQEPFASTIVDLVEPTTYADRTEYGDVVLVFRHTLTTLTPPAAGTHVVHRLEISGPGADEVGPELGPQISGDFDTSMAALFAAAREARAARGARHA